MVYFAVILSGGLGALLRYLTTNLANRMVVNSSLAALPFGTLLVNVVGSFLMGYFSWQLIHKLQLSKEIQTIVLTGFLGGFTTFSAFSLEMINLLESGFVGRAVIYLMSSVILCLLMCLLGLALARHG